MRYNARDVAGAARGIHLHVHVSTAAGIGVRLAPLSQNMAQPMALAMGAVKTPLRGHCHIHTASAARGLSGSLAGPSGAGAANPEPGRKHAPPLRYPAARRRELGCGAIDQASSLTQAVQGTWLLGCQLVECIALPRAHSAPVRAPPRKPGSEPRLAVHGRRNGTC